MNDKIISIAPGRTCLFGDHQDYLGLPVIACAISRYIKLEAVENDSDHFFISKPDINEQQKIRIDFWNESQVKGDHLLSALKVLRRYDCIPNRGFDITISGNLPINAGTSSSSAVIIAWIQFLLKAYGCKTKVNKEFISQVAYEAEVVEQDSPGGKMDQYSIGMGGILYLETGDQLQYEVIDKKIKGLVIGESGIPKETIGVLKELKEKGWLAIHKILEKDKNFNIREAKKENLSKYLKMIPDRLSPYLYAAVSNHDITQRARIELRKEDLDFKKIGDLMNEHHQILRDILRITLPRIDNMINAALENGAYGAKIVGSGKGGSIVALVPEEKAQKVINAIINAGGKDAYKVSVDEGAKIVTKEGKEYQIPKL